MLNKIFNSLDKNNYAIIIDEAHSSTSGENINYLNDFIKEGSFFLKQISHFVSSLKLFKLEDLIFQNCPLRKLKTHYRSILIRK